MRKQGYIKFDFDILATTSNKILIESVYRNENPVVYEAPKPAKIIFGEEDLYKSDLFSFGSIIGAITNKSTSGFALLNNLEKEYGKESREYKTTINRIKMCTKLQSAQIDKAKIGREVKGIPKIWTDRKYIESLEIDEEEKAFLKSIMLDRHPYFFIYLYPDTKKKYKKYIEKSDLSSKHKFGISLNELLVKEDKNEKEIEFIKNYNKYMPVIISDSVMNNICKYIENVNFDIKNKIKVESNTNIFTEYLSNTYFYNEDIYIKLLEEYNSFKKDIAQLSRIKNGSVKNKYDNDTEQQVNTIYEGFMNRMESVCSNVCDLVDHLILIFYCENPSSNKDLLWNCYGEIIFKNIKKRNTKPIMFPIPDTCGDIIYLNQKYLLKEVEVW